MTRLYYALFQAGVHAMEAAGKKPSDFRQGVDKWEHATICGNATLFRGSSSDLPLFREARSLREQADYSPVPVRFEQVEDLHSDVAQFIKDTCDDSSE